MRSIILGISRLFHIGSASFIIGNSFADMIWGSKSTSGTYLIAYIVCYVFLLISGIVTMATLRPSSLFEKYDQRVWVALMYVKFVLWILFIPIPDWIAASVGGTFPRNEFNGGLIFVVLLVSISAKLFRENNQIIKRQLLTR